MISPLAGSATGHVRAAGAFLTTRDTDARPSPAGASTRSAKNVNVRGRAIYCSMNIAERQTRDRHTVGRCACGRAVLVILLDDDAVLADAGERDVLVCHG
jgi:hypothetical protein